MKDQKDMMLLLCNSRTQPDLPEMHKDNGVGIYIPPPVIDRDRLDCMNLRTYNMPFMQFKYCIACDKWETTKRWNEGKERDGWGQPKNIHRVIIFTLTLITLMSVAAPLIYIAR